MKGKSIKFKKEQNHSPSLCFFFPVRHQAAVRPRLFTNDPRGFFSLTFDCSRPRSFSLPVSCPAKKCRRRRFCLQGSRVLLQAAVRLPCLPSFPPFLLLPRRQNNIPISLIFSLFSRLRRDLLAGFILSLSLRRVQTAGNTASSPALSLLSTMSSSSSSTAGESQTSLLSLSSIDNLLHFPSFFPTADLPGFLFLLRHRTSRTTHHSFFFLQRRRGRTPRAQPAFFPSSLPPFPLHHRHPSSSSAATHLHRRLLVSAPPSYPEFSFCLPFEAPN